MSIVLVCRVVMVFVRMSVSVVAVLLMRFMTMRCVVMPIVAMVVVMVATMCRMCLVVVCVIMLVVMRVPLLAPTSRKNRSCTQEGKCR